MTAFRVLSTALCAVLFSQQPATAETFRGWRPMPDRPGCHVTHCIRLWDDDEQRPFKRCYWRCTRPRRAPPAPQEWVQPAPQPAVPEPPRHRYKPPAPEPPALENYAAPVSETDEVPAFMLFLLAFAGLAALVIIARYEARGSTHDIDRALSEAAEAAAAQAKLAQATREADKVIQRQAASAFRRGRHS